MKIRLGQGRTATPARNGSRGGLRLTLIAWCALVAAVPTHAQATKADALAMMQAGRFAEAQPIWERLATDTPDSAPVHAALGFTLAQQGKLPQAVAEYRRSLALAPGQTSTLTNLALAEFKQGHFDETVAVIGQLPAAAQDRRTTLLLGMSHFGSRRYKLAEPYLQTAVDADPGNVELRSVLAQDCLRGLDNACALAQFKNILETNPDSVQAHMLLGQALDSAGRTPEAIVELEAAARIAPHEPDVHFQLGYLLYTRHEYDKAGEEFKAELADDQTNAKAMAYLGDVDLRNNDAVSAEPLLRRAAGADSNLRLAFLDLGRIFADQHKDKEALAALLRAEQLDPSEPDAHYRLARVYQGLGDKTKAAQEFALTKQLHEKTAESLIEKVSPDAKTKP